MPRVTLDGLKLQLSPLDGETDTPKLIVPVKPPRLVADIVTGAAVPPVNVTVAGLAVSPKSCTV